MKEKKALGSLFKRPWKIFAKRQPSTRFKNEWPAGAVERRERQRGLLLPGADHLVLQRFIHGRLGSRGRKRDRIRNRHRDRGGNRNGIGLRRLAVGLILIGVETERLLQFDMGKN